MLTASDLDTHAGLKIFQKICVERQACEPALDWIAVSIERGLTLTQCMDTAEERVAWAGWCRAALADLMDDGTRAIFGQIAGSDDPRTAAQLCIDHDDMNQDEALLLLAQWHSSVSESGEILFPTIEAELARAR